MKMIRRQYTLAVITNEINKCRNMGYVCFARYHRSVLFETNIFLINIDGYKLWLDSKKTCYFSLSVLILVPQAA